MFSDAQLLPIRGEGVVSWTNSIFAHRKCRVKLYLNFVCAVSTPEDRIHFDEILQEIGTLCNLCISRNEIPGTAQQN